MLRRWSPALVIVLALASTACGRDAARAGTAPAPSGTGLGAGPDGVLLRVARGGGRVSAYRWPRDSAVWKSPSALPGLARVLAFDPEQGALSFVALDGRVGRLELRVGTLTMGVREPLSAITSVDGASVFALDSAGALLRLTAAARWRLPLPTGTDQLFPLPDGSVFALVPHGRNATLLRARPPTPRLRDSVLVRAPQVIVPSPLGDRLWLADADGVRALRTRDLTLLDPIRVGGDVRLAVP
ncbi:MAG: hypothetical protein K2X99_00930, partial [Gemmatimonadaceae bacterium]|nr:hypothetical protein [Gemmatimonadaceae bacterium]